MKIQSLKYVIPFLATKFLVAFTAQSAIAFSFNYPPLDQIRAFDPYTYNDYETGNRIIGETNLMLVEELERGGTDALWERLNAFSNENPGQWEFIRAENDLEGSFEMDYYKACGRGTQCGTQGNNGVGADISVFFAPFGNDPIPDIEKSKNKLRWIQRVENNHSLEFGHGVPENVLDEDFESNRRNPYYYDRPLRETRPGFVGGVVPFDDTPYRRDPSESHKWIAELYLAEIIGNEGGREKVKIYNGIKWGWENRVTRIPLFKTFSDSLSSGTEVDKFNLTGLTPGAKFYAWTNNNIPSNRCNPNTYLSTYDDSGYQIGYNNDSSPEGDGFASGLMGTVSSNGTINLAVGAASGGRRGEDKGNYELYVGLYSPGESPPPEVIVGSSGGGGVSRPRPGNTQQNPILPNRTDSNWQVFSNVPGCRWYDPHTPYGFEFQALLDTLFTEILDFPVGIDNRFTVSVGDNILGEFSPGDSVDFVALLGSGVSNFKITGIDALIGDTEETAFPIQLAFNSPTGSFKMRPFSKPETPTPQSVPEPGSIVGLLALVGWSVRSIWKRKQR